MDNPETAKPDNAETGPLAALWGVGDLDAWFEGADVKAVPWPIAGESKPDRGKRARELTTFISKPAQLVEVDPRQLWAGQWGVVRHHAVHYLTGEWERTGRTSADRKVLSNQYPVIAQDHHGRLVIRVGHHRSLAALINGHLVRCRLLTPAAQSGDAVAVSPSLFIGTTSTLPHQQHTNPSQAAESITNGNTVIVPSREIATATLALLGLTAAEIAFRFRFR